jgi:molybdopterin-guanine dinucleotide biosynthesis protein A
VCHDWETGRVLLAAVVLAGGTAVRLGGVDKASIELDGRTFLEHSLAATAAAQEVVVVGDPVPTSRPVTFCREQPSLGGPAAALLAGRAALATVPELLVVLAVDMPRVTAATVERLVGGVDGDGSVLVGPDGRDRLALVVRTAALDAAAPADPHGLPLHRLLAPLDLAPVPALGDEARGVDRWEDLVE